MNKTIDYSGFLEAVVNVTEGSPYQLWLIDNSAEVTRLIELPKDDDGNYVIKSDGALMALNWKENWSIIVEMCRDGFTYVDASSAEDIIGCFPPMAA